MERCIKQHLMHDQQSTALWRKMYVIKHKVSQVKNKIARFHSCGVPTNEYIERMSETCRSINDGNSSVQYTQTALNFQCEVHVSYINNRLIIPTAYYTIPLHSAITWIQPNLPSCGTYVMIHLKAISQPNSPIVIYHNNPPGVIMTHLMLPPKCCPLHNNMTVGGL